MWPSGWWLSQQASKRKKAHAIFLSEPSYQKSQSHEINCNRVYPYLLAAIDARNGLDCAPKMHTLFKSIMVACSV